MITVKVILGLIFVLILFFACFNKFQKATWKKRVVIVLGIIPYFFILFLIGHVIRLSFPDNLVVEETTKTYIGLFLLPYLVLVLRMLFNTGMLEWAKVVIRTKEENMEKYAWYLFFFQDVFFFVGGLLIILLVSIKEIPNCIIINKVYKRPEILEKWIIISSDSKVLNQVSNSQFNIPREIQKDTLTYVFNDDDSTGWMKYKIDSITVNYSYNVDQLEINRNNKSWTLRILSQSENEMTIMLSDTSSITLSKTE